MVKVTRVPHALRTAYAALKADVSRSRRRHIGRSVEQFVDALYAISGTQDELRMRAKLIEARCGPGSEYERARKRALASYKGRPTKLTRSALAIGRLRKSTGTPLFLVEIDQERQDIENVLSDGTVKLTAAQRKAFQAWQAACRGVQREAEPLEVDGCWYLLNIHEASEIEPSKRAQAAKSIIETKVGEANHESIHAAAKSLIAWVRQESGASTGRPESESSAPDEASQPKPKRRGRKKADYESIQRDAEIAADWKRAREAGEHKVDFARDHIMTVKKFDNLLDRVAARRRSKASD